MSNVESDLARNVLSRARCRSFETRNDRCIFSVVFFLQRNGTTQQQRNTTAVVHAASSSRRRPQECHAACPRNVDDYPPALLLLLLPWKPCWQLSRSSCYGGSIQTPFFSRRRQKRYVPTAKFNFKNPTDQKDKKKKM